MRTESDRAPIELAIFAEFAKRQGLSILAGSLRKGDATRSEPDILCTLESGEVLAFELTEACAPEFAELETRALKAHATFAWGNDVSEKTVRKKLTNTYSTDSPVELLIYTNGRTALTDEMIAAKLEPIFQIGLGQFRRVWLMGDEISEIASLES